MMGGQLKQRMEYEHLDSWLLYESVLQVLLALQVREYVALLPRLCLLRINGTTKDAPKPLC